MVIVVPVGQDRSSGFHSRGPKFGAQAASDKTQEASRGMLKRAMETLSTGTWPAAIECCDVKAQQQTSAWQCLNRSYSAHHINCETCLGREVVCSTRPYVLVCTVLEDDDGENNDNNTNTTMDTIEGK